MTIDRRSVIAALGGLGAVERMDAEARVEGLEEYLSQELDATMRARLGLPGLEPKRPLAGPAAITA